MISENAATPTQSSPKFIGLDIYSAHTAPIFIPANGGTATVITYITLEPPSGTYARIASRSSLVFKNNVHVIGRVIDPYYRGNIKIGLINQSDILYIITHKDRISQIILEKINITPVSVVESLISTIRNTQLIGNTETRKEITPSIFANNTNNSTIPQYSIYYLT